MILQHNYQESRVGKINREARERSWHPKSVENSNVASGRREVERAAEYDGGKVRNSRKGDVTISRLHIDV